MANEFIRIRSARLTSVALAREGKSSPSAFVHRPKTLLIRFEMA